MNRPSFVLAFTVLALFGPGTRAVSAVGSPFGASPFEASHIGISPTQETRDTAASPRSGMTSAELDRLTSSVASRIRCVVCRGLSIQDSPSDLARRMKSVVREQLAAGRTPDEVKAYFVAKYGEWVLLTPKPRGFNLLVYVLPAVALVTGLGVIIFAVRRWTRPAAHE